MTDLPNQENLRKAWEQVWNLFEPDNSWNSNSAKCRAIQTKLAYFKSDHCDSPDHIDKVIKALSRGVPLTQAAMDWGHPAISDVEKPPRTIIQKLRGTQWRLVMAYSGFEITAKGLMNNFDRKTDPHAIAEFLHKCTLSSYKALVSPNSTGNQPNLDKWLSKGEQAIAEFLGVSAGDAKIIKQWIVESKAVSSWEEAFKLAKALRNATAHGFLLPTKVSEWKLKPGFERLTDNLAEIMATGLKKLTEPAIAP